MLLAVLHRHAGVMCGDQDVFVNAVGGVRIQEPAADLAVLLAIVSSLRNKPLPGKWVAFGEIGLAGEIRPAPRGQERLKEAAKLGFTHALIPKANAPKQPIKGIEIIALERVEQAIEQMRGVVMRLDIAHVVARFACRRLDRARFGAGAGGGGAHQRRFSGRPCRTGCDARGAPAARRRSVADRRPSLAGQLSRCGAYAWPAARRKRQFPQHGGQHHGKRRCASGGNQGGFGRLSVARDDAHRAPAKCRRWRDGNRAGAGNGLAR